MVPKTITRLISDNIRNHPHYNDVCKTLVKRTPVDATEKRSLLTKIMEMPYDEISEYFSVCTGSVGNSLGTEMLALVKDLNQTGSSERRRSRQWTATYTSSILAALYIGVKLREESMNISTKEETTSKEQKQPPSDAFESISKRIDEAIFEDSENKSCSKSNPPEISTNSSLTTVLCPKESITDTYKRVRELSKEYDALCETEQKLCDLLQNLEDDAKGLREALMIDPSEVINVSKPSIPTNQSTRLESDENGDEDSESLHKSSKKISPGEMDDDCDVQSQTHADQGLHDAEARQLTEATNNNSLNTKRKTTSHLIRPKKKKVHPPSTTRDYLQQKDERLIARKKLEEALFADEDDSDDDEDLA